MRLRSMFAAVSIAVMLAANASAAFSIDNLISGTNPLPIPGNQSWPGQLGDDFLVGPSNLAITSIAVFDDNGNGTTKPLIWQLFEVTTGTLLHTQVVPPTPNTPGPTILDNYVFAPTAPIILLAGGQYSVVATGFDDANPNFNTNIPSPPPRDVDFNETDFKAFGGRYSNGPSPFLPNVDAGNFLSGNPYNFGAAAFVYAAVPEASSFLVMGFGGLFAVGGVWIGRRYGLKFDV
jgi:hypothetical protein